MVDRVVIAGSGQAGFQVAASLRTDGFDGTIIMIGDEPGLPYQRPPLSKAYLKEGVEDRLLFRNADFFEKNRVELFDGVSVTQIDRAGHTVTLSNGGEFAYDHLVLAIGARNRRLPIPGAALNNVLELRTLDHARLLRSKFEGATSLAVIGGGFIGLEVAATARAFGLDVTVIEATSRLMSRVVSPPVSNYFLAVHREMGTDVRLDSMARAILDDGKGNAAGVELNDGAHVKAELVLVSAGVVPNVELAEAAGLYVHDGIRVDDLMLTEDPAISAIGDCASFPFGQDGTVVRLESVQNAVDQAKCVSLRLVGRPEAYHKVPWFWSDQGPHKLQIAGLTQGADHHEIIEQDGKLTVQCYRRDELLGVETVNAAGEHMAARRLLAQPEPLRLETAAHAGFDLVALSKAAPRG
jgi:3-phenylpropionate/trans-cinnamate dioxygenase ferredoxin reductase subunit